MTRIGNRLAPPRFLAFVGVLAVALPALVPVAGWRHGTMAGFDVAAIVFLASLRPLFAGAEAGQMRRHAGENDANRVLLLVVTAAVLLVILVAVGSELVEKGAPRPAAIALIVATLLIAWTFSNMVYALHYAHMFYSQSDTDGDGTREDSRGLDFPKTPEPLYWDFVYYAFTLGMTFQTSDVETTTTRMRIVTIFHCLAAFVFNLGVIAFTVNVLGG